MKNFLPLLLAGAFLLAGQPLRAAPTPDAALVAARDARDQADIAALRQAIARDLVSAQQTNTAAAYLRLALFEYWLCEAAHGHDDDKLVAASAQAGIAYTEKSIKLDPNLAEAHRLQGVLLGELIPQVFAGGMRYGSRAAAELDRAIQLDPHDAEALIGRAFGYFSTPAAFGGSRSKAIELLNQAVALDPASDTAHLWLAQVYHAQSRPVDALREINEASRLNPNRAWTHRVFKQIEPAK